MFGSAASREIGALLDAAGVRFLGRAVADVPSRNVVEVRRSGERLEVDRIVTLPVMSGPAITGLPHDADGFLPVDRHGRVIGAPRVYAAGDATDFAIKHGGLACLQADAAAEAIAAEAGVTIEPSPFRPVLRAVLVTERECRWLQRDLSDERDGGAIAEEPQWSPPTKLPSRELGAYLPQIHTHGALPH
jgi:sulfide:quinone oxidoreductase